MPEAVNDRGFRPQVTLPRGALGFLQGNQCRHCPRRFRNSAARRRHERRTHAVLPVHGASGATDEAQEAVESPAFEFPVGSGQGAKGRGHAK